VTTEFVLHRWRWRARFTHDTAANYAWGVSEDDALSDLVNSAPQDVRFYFMTLTYDELSRVRMP
jgi:hypothetical protein